MKRLLYLVLGYTKLRFKKDFFRKVLNLANKHNIRIIEAVICDDYAEIKIFTFNEKKLLHALKADEIEPIVIDRKGILAFAKKYSHRAGIITGIAIFFAALYISPLFIWEINITGIEKLSREHICSILKDEGVYIGAFSPKIERQTVHEEILKNNEDISWISVNFIGSSANVEVVERDYTITSNISADAANIIAAKDGQIIETDVICGRRIVKKGDIVKKGEVLVSGVYDTGKMGTRYVYSQANVYAAVCDEYTIEVPLNNLKKVYQDEVVLNKDIKMFGKSINFYKNYSILEVNYDTISKEEKMQVLGLEELPISLITVCAIPYINEETLLTEEEALRRAQSEFYLTLDRTAEYADTLSIEESYTVENSVLIYKAMVEAIQNIALTSEFEIK